eukprot:TRINITY_DN6514_c0_g1_i1.p1 TRINITY_DN6514_c0_g1~~TRINITY_DN6514_c0_g1_i1.p1  ORF type:complete len:400 (-),score=107.45 TRINITY_DN6514_c0_g1_i1:92-1291(-)
MNIASVGIGIVAIYVLVRLVTITLDTLHWRSIASEMENLTRDLQSKPSPWRGKKFLILCNPYGGSKMGRPYVTKVVTPLLEQAQIRSKIFFTEGPNHASRILQSVEIEDFDVLLLVSGDGLLHESLNGLSSRCLSNPEFFRMLKKLPLAILPAGSSNGMSTSLGGRYVIPAMRNILYGHAKPVDLLQVHLGQFEDNFKMKTETQFWDCGHVSWGLISFHDWLQEKKLRGIPTHLRNLLAPLISIVWKPKFRGKLSMKPHPIDAEQTKKEGYRSAASLDDSKQFGDGWKEMRDDLLLVSGCNMPYLAYDIQAAPFLHLGEGAVALFVLKHKISRQKLLSIFLKLDSGKHVFEEDVQVFKVKEFAIQPQGRNPGEISLSGELFPTSDVLVKTHTDVLHMVY